jgi:hypothetical protein
MEPRNILDHFAELNDPREDNIRHLLIDIIAIVICASICGAETWEDIESFAEAKSEWLKRFLARLYYYHRCDGNAEGNSGENNR